MNSVIRSDMWDESRSWGRDGKPDLVRYPEMETRRAFPGGFQPLM